jgi:hypothetical protein
MKANGWQKSQQTFTCGSSGRVVARMCALDVFGAADGPVSASTLAEENLRLSVCPKVDSQL